MKFTFLLGDSDKIYFLDLQGKRHPDLSQIT